MVLLLLIMLLMSALCRGVVKGSYTDAGLSKEVGKWCSCLREWCLMCSCAKARVVVCSVEGHVVRGLVFV